MDFFLNAYPCEGSKLKVDGFSDHRIVAAALDVATTLGYAATVDERKLAALHRQSSRHIPVIGAASHLVQSAMECGRLVLDSASPSVVSSLFLYPTGTQSILLSHRLTSRLCLISCTHRSGCGQLSNATFSTTQPYKSPRDGFHKPSTRGHRLSMLLSKLCRNCKTA